MDERAKLRWQCRRGAKELDLLLGNYLENHYLTAEPAEKTYFLSLLELEDSVLLSQFSQIAARLSNYDGCNRM